ncbi:MAG: sigma-54-dependent transcriptional regulator [Nitrospinaceae bacterium]
MKQACSILVVDDEPEMRAALTATLQREGFHLETAVDGEEALERFSGNAFDLVITDIRMPRRSGPGLLRAIKQKSPDTQVIMTTAYGTIDNAVETMKAGASDYLLKPFSADVLVSTVNRALIRPAPGVPATGSKKTARPQEGSRRIVTDSPVLEELLKFAENIAYSKSTVLICGETGTGKELFSRHIHASSPRADKPFLAVNCAALPEGLLESELFGHEKGAFTGAIARKEGKFELANKGTLLLDEVTEMTPPLQAKLLRVLQEHEIDKVGGRQPIPVDVRVIATTNRDPRALVAEGKFREDLFYRLNVIPMKLPPLRDRPEDIPVLAKFFFRKHAAENGRRVRDIAAETLHLLQGYRWRGNVRELENVIERAVLLCPGETILPGHLFMEETAESAGALSGAPARGFKGTISDMERELIFQALGDLGGNKTKAAFRLGISIRTLRNKLAEYREKGLEPVAPDAQAATA